MDIPRICGHVRYEKIGLFVLPYCGILFVAILVWFNLIVTSSAAMRETVRNNDTELYAAIQNRAIFSLSVSVKTQEQCSSTYFRSVPGEQKTAMEDVCSLRNWTYYSRGISRRPVHSRLLQSVATTPSCADHADSAALPIADQLAGLRFCVELCLLRVSGAHRYVPKVHPLRTVLGGAHL